MEQMTVDGVKVEVTYKNDGDAKVTEKEARAYVSRAHDKYPGQQLDWLKLEVDGETVTVQLKKQ